MMNKYACELTNVIVDRIRRNNIPKEKNKIHRSDDSCGDEPICMQCNDELHLVDYKRHSDYLFLLRKHVR